LVSDILPGNVIVISGTSRQRKKDHKADRRLYYNEEGPHTITIAITPDQFILL